MAFVTAHHLAEKTEVPEFRIRQWIKMGILQGFRAGNRFYVNDTIFEKQLHDGTIDALTKNINAYIRAE